MLKSTGLGLGLEIKCLSRTLKSRLHPCLYLKRTTFTCSKFTHSPTVVLQNYFRKQLTINSFACTC